MTGNSTAVVKVRVKKTHALNATLNRLQCPETEKLGKSPTEVIFQRHEMQVALNQSKNMAARCKLEFSPFSSMNTNLICLHIRLFWAY